MNEQEMKDFLLWQNSLPLEHPSACRDFSTQNGFFNSELTCIVADAWLAGRKSKICQYSVDSKLEQILQKWENYIIRLHDAYEKASVRIVCCGYPNYQECCGNPNYDWSDEAANLLMEGDELLKLKENNKEN